MSEHMSEHIKNHDFESAKLAIKRFSEQTPTDLSLTYVNEKKGVGEWLGDAIFGGGFKTEHVVTGEELNGLTEQIQAHFRRINSTEIKLVQEFGQVYCALQALDKDYIQWIIDTINALKETNNRIDQDNARINMLQKNQLKTLGVLSDFKKKLEAYKHLSDIDEIWSDCQKWHEEIPALLSSLSDTVSTVEANAEDIADVRNTMGQISTSLSEQIERINALRIFVDGLEAITHLRDIDGMWDSLSNAHMSLEKLFDELKSVKAVAVKHQQDIDKALSFIETVSQYEHLKDIDTIWGNVEDHGKKLEGLVQRGQKTDEAVAQNKKDVAELNQGLSAITHLKDVDNLWESNETHSAEIKELQEQGKDARKLIQQNKDLADQSLADEKSRTETALQSLNRKIQYAYWIAGGSIALALIELLVILLG